MEEIHFYHEIQKERYYEALVPQKGHGLVIVLLYEQWQTGIFAGNSFTETAVKECVEKVWQDTGRAYERIPRGQVRDVIRKLREYFLFLNESTHQYKLTQYAIDFCENLKAKLENEIRPSEIEKIMAELIMNLRNYAAKSEFTYWFTYIFKPAQTPIKNQVEALYRQMIAAVQGFRSLTNQNELRLLDKVREIDRSLDIVKNQAAKLQLAFQDADVLTSELNTISVADVEGKYGSDIREIRNFIAGVREELVQIGRRIDPIRPKLRQFINNINQRSFDRNTELFLKNLLLHTSIKRTTSGTEILLPDAIEQKKVRATVPKLLLVRGKRFLPTLPQKVFKPIQDPESRRRQVEEARAQLEIRKRIQQNLRELHRLVETSDQVEFADFYYAILQNESSNPAEIAGRTAYEALQKYTRLPLYNVTIEGKPVQHEQFPHTAIWKMTIEKKGKKRKAILNS